MAKTIKLVKSPYDSDGDDRCNVNRAIVPSVERSTATVLRMLRIEARLVLEKYAEAIVDPARSSYLIEGGPHHARKEGLFRYR